MLSLLLLAMAAPALADGPAPSSPSVGGDLWNTLMLGPNTELQLDTDSTFTRWEQDDSAYLQKHKAKVAVKKVIKKHVVTKKLTNVVPPIHFASGQAKIPQEYIEKLRTILNSMRDRTNVRLHFVGYTDNVPLFGEAKKKYGDNMGLSKERAGTAAEYFKKALDLPPEAISYEGLGDSKPIASNQTEAGRAENRRVEIEVWYDEVSEKTVDKEVKLDRKIKRIKVCRVETMCLLHYKEGHSRRAVLKNLVPPLHYDETVGEIPQRFLNQLRQALQNLKDKNNVQIRFIGYTDDTPLSGRDARIYGDNVGISKANARRVALAVQDALHLPSQAVASTGKGAAYPIASNSSDRGRALNRRVEVEFWYDDPMEDLPDTPQICPEAAAAETVERIYNPPDGELKPIYFKGGKPVIPPGYVDRLKRGMAAVADKGNVRLRFIGYTGNRRLDRRTARVYGDDVGLSTSRARRAMEAIKHRMGLADKQTEYEGHGYVQSNDVVNSGFVTSDKSKVVVQIVYDELAMLENDDGVLIKRVTRDVHVRNPYSLNLMRISVDGQPLNDPGKNIEDVERCTDVALDKAKVQFKFDDLALKPRLNITAWPNVISERDNPSTPFIENQAWFRLYSNFPAFIKRAEVRIFADGESTRGKPLAVIPLDSHGEGKWQFRPDGKGMTYHAPRTKYQYLVRVYGKHDAFDETKAQTLWVVDQTNTDHSKQDPDKELLVGYGENRLGLSNIVIPGNGGTVSVFGKDVPEGYQAWFGGYPIPVNDQGEFGAELILPAGLQTVEVSITDKEGNGDVYLRDLKLKHNDWFYVGIADLTFARDKTNGPAKLVTGDTTHYDNDLSVDGRLAFYTKGKFSAGTKLTASADTREGPVKELFTNFVEKTPDAVFRRLDSKYAYPTFGDDSTLHEDAPTSGKFYVKVEKDDNYGMWGNFNVAYTDNYLAHIDRALYGANTNLESDATTSFGEKRFGINAFAAEPGTLGARDELRGTGGSLYYLRHQDILTGSDRIRVEIRDGISGEVVGVKNLVSGLDYDIDYIQGRVLLRQPLSSFAASTQLINGGDLSAYQSYLVARYEYTPGFTDLKDIAKGGRAHYWFGDHVKLGLTAENLNSDSSRASLNGADVTLRKNTGTWLRIEQSASEGTVSTSLMSNDGGFNYTQGASAASPDVRAMGRRVDGSLDLADVTKVVKGKVTMYRQQLDAGYSSPGLSAPTDTTINGGTAQVDVTPATKVKLHVVSKKQQDALSQSAAEVDVMQQLTRNWSIEGGLRHDNRQDHSPIVPATQVQGKRNDAAVKLNYDSLERWSSYGYLQQTVSSDGNRERNGRVGVGGRYRSTDRLSLNGEVSGGDMGTAAKMGTEYKITDKTNIYSAYTLENGRTDNGVRARRGNLSAGFKTHYSDSASVYMEERYTYGDVPTGLTHSMGFDLAATDSLNFGGSVDVGTLRDNVTAAKIERKAAALRVGYHVDNFTYAGALEYRKDDTQASDLSTSTRTTWLTKNSIKYQLNPNWRLLGKLNHSTSHSTLGEFYDGNFTEAVMGYAYRPVDNDALNTLFKYTYFYNLPSSDQLTVSNTAAAYIQKSHILSLDVMYDVTRHWSLGGKYAYRMGELAQDRTDPVFFKSNAVLYILRADWHVIRKWDVMLEGRMLKLPQAGDRRSGFLTGIYRHIGNHLKLGMGYNFTDFSDDLTDLSYDSKGAFINVIGKF
ncbi:MAG TPA: OmpA family protein [Gammaproteobacteria bacterium]|nr:OmpA family protein [Gammaproteobacteria bacterium]